MSTAVICEFNPFHNGHKYLLNRIKELSDEPIIAVMSGSFTQRGEVAITDKWSRAQTALKNGVDLVLELPAVYSVASACRFAFGGVSVAKSFSCVKHLAFGCETDDVKLLTQAAKASHDKRVGELLSAKMKGGDYYPRAIESAVREVFGTQTAEVFASPNNTLAVEYINQIIGTDIKPMPILRVGAEHDSDKSNGGYASASYIRSRLRKQSAADELMPSVPELITYPEKLEQAYLYKLRSMSVDDIRRLPEVSEGLENRIYSAVLSSSSVGEIIDKVKTKRYTHARLRRILSCALLGISEADQKLDVDFVRVLGFTKRGSQILGDCRLKVVTSVAKAIREGAINTELLKKDIFATDVFALALKDNMPCSMDYTEKIVII